MPLISKLFTLDNSCVTLVCCFSPSVCRCVKICAMWDLLDIFTQHLLLLGWTGDSQDWNKHSTVCGAKDTASVEFAGAISSRSFNCRYVCTFCTWLHGLHGLGMPRLHRSSLQLQQWCRASNSQRHPSESVRHRQELKKEQQGYTKKCYETKKMDIFGVFQCFCLWMAHSYPTYRQKRRRQP